MKLSSKQIENIHFTIQERGYSPKEVDELLDKIIEDYEELESKNNGKVIITKDFNGIIDSDTVVFEGTIEQWKALRLPNYIRNIPCINCKDGLCIQRL